MKTVTTLPEGLFWHPLRGYCFARIDESICELGEIDRKRAIQLAMKYNDTYRIDVELAHGITELDPESTELPQNKHFRDFLDKLPAMYLEHDSPGENTYSTFVKDCERLSEVVGNLPGTAITMTHVNAFLEKFCAGKSNNVYNRKVAFLIKAFSFACDRSVMKENPALVKMRKKKEKKARKRLHLEHCKTMLQACQHHPELHFLYIAMMLSFQTTHAVNEIANLKYQDILPLEKPDTIQGMTVYGFLYIHRQKTQEHEASRVKIPITEQLQTLIDQSKDGLACPYIVHRKPEKRSNPVSQHCTHEYQLTNNYVSRAFSKLRDRLNLYPHLTTEQKPTFHEIRALAADQFAKAGYDPQARMAHTDAKSTKVYLEGHVEWTEVPPAELKI